VGLPSSWGSFTITVLALAAISVVVLRGRQSGTALAVCWALGSLGAISGFALLAVLLIPALVFLPFWVAKAFSVSRREPPQAPAVVAQS